MTKNRTAKRRISRQRRQPGASRKRPCPDYGIVTPVVAARSVPSSKSCREQWSVVARCKLLHARKESLPANKARHCLDETGLRRCLHGCRQPEQRVGSHHAIGVEDDEIGIVRAAPFD